LAKIIIVGLGPGSEEGISLGVWHKLQRAKHVYLRTGRHPIIEKFPQWKIDFQSFDNLYEADNFEEVYDKIVDCLLKEAKEYGEVVYAVPGSPFAAETTVDLLRQKSKNDGIELEIHPALTCNYPLDPLVEVMDKLLGPDGCPWDRKQNHLTLKRYLLEEVYEVIEAIDEGNMYKFCEELGDLLLQIIFNAALASRCNQFTINDVISEITNKMIRRHPHVFAGLKISGTQDVMKNWEEIKAKEKGEEVAKTLLGSVPKDLPALMHAYKIQEKAADAGFDWPHISGAWEKVAEELNELEVAINEKDNVYEELGDLLFSVVNVARFLKINPEEALLFTIRKFRHRFQFIENKALEEGKSVNDYFLEKLDKWWEESKK